MHDVNVTNDTMPSTNTGSMMPLCEGTVKNNHSTEVGVGIVYKSTCSVNGKVYIGVTSKTLKKRRQQHFQLSRTKNPNYLFHKAIRKYGTKNFMFEVIDTFNSVDERNVKEINHIATYNSFYLNGSGYNMTRGGDGSLGHFFLHTEEAKRKISKACMGKPKSEETRERMREAQRKRNLWFTYKHTDETRRKIAESSRLRKCKSPSMETREKLRLANVGKKQSAETIEKRRKKLIGKIRTQSYRDWLSATKTKSIPANIYNVIVECVKVGLTPYCISEKLMSEYGYKIDRKTIKKRWNEFNETEITSVGNQ